MARAWAALLAVCVAARARGSAAAPLAADGEVHTLTASSFDEEVARHSLVFVEFYAPWCGHCKKLVPEWEQLAKDATRLGIPIATVDAIAEQPLAKRHAVESFPTLKLFSNGPHVAKVYKGPRVAPKMAEWLKAWKGASLLQTLKPSASEVQSWIRGRSFALVGLLTGDAVADRATVQLLEAASFMMNPQSPADTVPVGVVTGVGARALGLGDHEQEPAAPAIVALRDFELESRVLIYPQPSKGSSQDVQVFVAWAARGRVPLLIPAQKDTEEFFLQNIDPDHGLVIYFGSTGAFHKDFREVASEQPEPKVKWVHATADEFGLSLAKNVGLTEDAFPEVVLWVFGETEDQDKVFRLSQQPGASLTKAAVKDFLRGWGSGDLKAEGDPVLAVTSETFDSAVLRSDKDVLVEFYAPWCGHCKSLAPEYKQLALHYSKDSGIDIVKMDATKHKHPSAEVKSYPTLKFYPKGKKDAPVDPGFKAGRTKDTLVAFIEEHRRSKAPAQSVPLATGKAEKGAPPAAKAVAPSAATTGTVGASSSQREGRGYWIVDDLSEPASFGSTLSEDMVASRNGFTLVEAGPVGLLLSSAKAKASAVRRFGSLAEAQVHVTGVLHGRGPDRLPCPADANASSCLAWCERVSAGTPGGVHATVEGSKCSWLSKGSVALKPLQCNCLDRLSYDHVQAMCLSPCSADDARATAPAPAQTASLGTGSAAAAAGAVCRAGDAQCSASAVAARRYFLYDTKIGEGFNLQREVFPRAGWVVAQLNDRLFERCGPQVEGDCARWTLVLPPWCRVAHWRSGTTPLPWSTFFDAGALRGSSVPVVEFEEYVSATGGSAVDLIVNVETDPMQPAPDASAARGKFLGWAADVQQCTSKFRKVPDATVLASGELEMVYSGECDGGIRTKSFRCASLDGPWPEGVVDLLASLKQERSVLIKGYDFLLSPDNDALDVLHLREAMLFSQEIRKAGDDFIALAFGGRPYLASHCRRTDFLRVREKTTPSAEVVAQQLNDLLQKHQLDQVFVATDAPDDLRDELRKLVKGSVVFFDETRVAAVFDHRGKKAAAEIWIASRADFFIGTVESRFTMAIQMERGFLGKHKKTSSQELCKEFESGKTKPCLAPKYRHPGRRGKFRENYIVGARSPSDG